MIGQAFPDSDVRRTVWFAGPSVSSSRVTPEGATLLRDLGNQLVVVDYEDYSSWEGAVADLTDPTQFARLPRTDGTDGRVAVIDPVSIELEPSSATLGISTVDRAVRVLTEIYAIRHQQGPADRSMIPERVSDSACPMPGWSPPSSGSPAPIGPSSSVHCRPQRSPPRSSGSARTICGSDGLEVQRSTSSRVAAVETIERGITDIAPMLPDGDGRPAAWADRLTGTYSSLVTATDAAEAASACPQNSTPSPPPSRCRRPRCSTSPETEHRSP